MLHNRNSTGIRLLWNWNPAYNLNFIRLTCCSTSWHRVSRDDSWVAETAEVQAVPVVVVLLTNKKKTVITQREQFNVKNRHNSIRTCQFSNSSFICDLDFWDTQENLSPHLSHQLSMHFGDAVDSARSLYADIWRRVTRGSGTEGTNGAGDKQTQAVLCCNVQDVVKPCENEKQKF